MSSKRLYYAKGISEAGNSLRYIAFPLATLSIRGNPADIAVGNIIASIADVTASLIAPFFIDRFPRLRVLIAADLLAVLVNLGTCYALYVRSLPLVFAMILAITSVTAFHSLALSAATADLATPGEMKFEGMRKGFSFLFLATVTGGAVGALFGIPLVNHVPFYGLILIDGVTFLVSSGIVLHWLLGQGVPPAQTSTNTETLSGILAKAWADWKAGLQAAAHNPVARRNILSQGLLGVAHGLLGSTTIAHYKTTLGVKDSFVFVSQLNSRIWTLIGAAWSLRLNIPASRAITLGTSLIIVGYFAMSLSPFFLFLLFYGIQQVGNSLVVPANQATIMGSVDPEMRGRIGAFRGLVIDVGDLTGSITAAALISAAGTSVVFAVAGVVAVVSLRGLGANRTP